MKLNKTLACLALIGTIWASCNEEKDPVQEMDMSSLETVISSSGNMAFVSHQRTTDSSHSSPKVKHKSDGIWSCKNVKYSLKRGVGGNEGFPEYNTNASIVYPGALIQGKSLNVGNPAPIVVKRAGGTISWDIVNGSKSSSSVDEVSKSSIQDAMNEVLDSSASFPADFSMTYTQIHSEEHLKFEMGISDSSPVANMRDVFGFSIDHEKNSYLVKLTQSFYTMSFDLPKSRSDLFHHSVIPNDLAKYVQPGNPATYVSDVTYGRVYYMLIQSSSLEGEMKIAVEGAFNVLVDDGKDSERASLMAKLEDLTINVKGYGGDSKSTLAAVSDTNNLKGLISNLVKSTKLGSGKPLSYVVRNVSDNQIVATKLATEYDLESCSLIIEKHEPPAWLKHWHGANGVHAKLGGIGAILHYGKIYEQKFILFSKDGKKFVHSTNASLSEVYDLKDLAKQSHLDITDKDFLNYAIGVDAAIHLDFYQFKTGKEVFEVFLFALNNGEFTEYLIDEDDKLDISRRTIDKTLLAFYPYPGRITSMSTSTKNAIDSKGILAGDFTKTRLGNAGGDNLGNLKNHWKGFPADELEAMTYFKEGNDVGTYIWVLGSIPEHNISAGRFYCVGQMNGSTMEYTVVDLKD